jgi:hypothetical protein
MLRAMPSPPRPRKPAAKTPPGRAEQAPPKRVARPARPAETKVPATPRSKKSTGGTRKLAGGTATTRTTQAKTRRAGIHHRPGRGERAGPPWQRARRTLLALWRAPGFVQAALILMLLAVLLPASNWLYQVARKPSELFFPVSDTLFKTPAETWATYAPLFHAHSTALMTPELLAALAQSEASGNPVARTYWRWSWSLNPFEIYRPASSAVGMYQITDGTFEEARRYCIRGHRVTADGPWHDWESCWFNELYTRVLPSHAVEMTAANLDRRVHETLARKDVTRASLRQKQDLAIVTHLCGAGAGAKFAARGLRPYPGQRCGDHPLQHYLDRVHGYVKVFEKLRARG